MICGWRRVVARGVSGLPGVKGIRPQLLRAFSEGPSDDGFVFKGHPLPPCTDKHHLRIESNERYSQFLKSSSLKQKLFWGKLGLLALVAGLVPIMGGITGFSAAISGIGLVLLAFDKRVSKHLRRIIISQAEERNMINVDIQK